MTVESPHGVSLPVALLVEGLPKRPTAGAGPVRPVRPVRALFGMDTEGAAALVGAGLWPDAEVRWFHLDAYVAAKVRRVLADNGCDRVVAEALADPPPGPFDVVALPFPRTTESLLTTDLVEAAHDALRVGGRLVVATDGGGAGLVKTVEKTFGKSTPGPRIGRRGLLLFAERRREAPQRKDRAHVLTPEVRPAGGGDLLTLRIETRPGTFSHGSLDRGTRALLEWYVPGGDRSVLDLGSGCGAIGIYAALRAPEARVVLVESNVRAAECAVRNAARNGVADRAEVLVRADLEDLPRAPADAGWDRVLANPPYFGDLRIAASFCRAAHRALRPGGGIALVVRRGHAANSHAEVLREVFRNVTPFDGGDYAILTAKR